MREKKIKYWTFPPPVFDWVRWVVVGVDWVFREWMPPRCCEEQLAAATSMMVVVVVVARLRRWRANIGTNVMCVRTTAVEWHGARALRRPWRWPLDARAVVGISGNTNFNRHRTRSITALRRGEAENGAENRWPTEYLRGFITRRHRRVHNIIHYFPYVEEGVHSVTLYRYYYLLLGCVYYFEPVPTFGDNPATWPCTLYCVRHSFRERPYNYRQPVTLPSIEATVAFPWSRFAVYNIHYPIIPTIAMHIFLAFRHVLA